MNEFFSAANLAYWSVVIATVTATTATIGQLWKRRENARWTIGWFIIFFWGFFMVLFGHFDANTWLALFFGVGFAGAIKVGFELITNSREAEQQRRKANADGHER